MAAFRTEAATETGLDPIHATKTDPRQHERCLQRDAHPITGWPLKPLARLDREGARGCLADLATAGLLSRQAAFVVLACADLRDPSCFLAQLAITASGAAGIGEALRTRTARDLIGAGAQASPTADGMAAILRLPGGALWQFRCRGGTLAIESSLWIDGAWRAVTTQQLVVSGEAAAGGASVSWTFKRAK